MSEAVKTRKEFLEKLPVIGNLLELESSLLQNNWKTSVESYSYIKEGEDYYIRLKLYDFIYAEHYSYDNSMHIILLDDELNQVDEYSLDTDRFTIFRKAEDILSQIEEKQIERRYDEEYNRGEAKYDAMKEDKI